MQSTIKALTLISLGFFLYSRFWNGNLFFYIHERFVWLIIFAAIGLVVLGASYSYRSKQAPQPDWEGPHQAAFSWSSIVLLLLPVVLGLLTPPKPLGAAAMVNRDVSLESLTTVSGPEDSEVIIKPAGEKNVLDWLIDFGSAPDLSVFAGEEVEVIGFVYRDDRFDREQFMVSRFVVSCCAADAAPIGLIVEWPDSADLAADQWVAVSGVLEIKQFAGEEKPVIMAASVEPTDIPDRPYLYPF